MQLVPESILTSTNNNPRCSTWISRRLNLNFKSMAAKQLYDVNFDDWSNYGSSWNCRIRSAFWVCSRVCVLSACCGAISKIIIHVRNGLVTHTSRYLVLERCVFRRFSYID